MAQYQLPPWLAQSAAPNPAQAFISMLPEGVRIAQEQQRLAQASQLAAAERDERQQELARKSELEQQRMAVEQAQIQMEHDLKQQQVSQGQQELDMAAQKAARQFSAQQQVDADTQAMIRDQGMDPDSARIRAVFKNSLASGAGSAEMAALVRSLRPAAQLPNAPMPEERKLSTGQPYLVEPKSGRALFPPQMRPPDNVAERQMALAQFRAKEKQLEMLQKQDSDPLNAQLVSAAKKAKDDGNSTPYHEQILASDKQRKDAIKALSDDIKSGGKSKTSLKILSLKKIEAGEGPPAADEPPPNEDEEQ